MRHLILEGSPTKRGNIHGEEWSKEINEFAAIRKEILAGVFKKHEQDVLKNLVDKHLSVLKKDEELWQEFSAIASASKMSLHDLMILNNHTDIRDFAELNSSDIADLLECSCFASLLNKEILIGQTWDMHASARPYVAHLTIKKEDSTQEIFTLTGCLALTGISTHGTGVFINNLRSKELSIGLAWPALVRKLLDQKSIEEAQLTIQDHMPSAGRSFMISSKSEVKAIEVTGQRSVIAGTLSKNSSQTLLHTNHYLSELKDSEDLSTRSQTTLNRYTFLDAHLKKFSDSKSSDLGTGVLLNDTQEILSITPPPGQPHASATCGGLLYNYASKSGRSFSGNYKENDYFDFKL